MFSTDTAAGYGRPMTYLNASKDMRVYIGYDEREARSFKVAMGTAVAVGARPQPLYEDRLRSIGLLYRPMDTRGHLWDLNSGAPQSTAFAIARFFTPILAHSGWCMFVDGDVVFLRNPLELMQLADSKYAVMVVKHNVGDVDGTKMDNRIQTSYPRKLWSSVMLWNVDHPANRRLNIQMLNQWPGRDLHAFGWLHDEEIGELPVNWNWLVGMQNKPENLAIAHYTLGTPELIEGGEHADIWHDAKVRCGIA